MISTQIQLAGLLALLIAPIAVMAVNGARAKREDEHDILVHGRAAIGTVIAVDEIAIRGGLAWKITVEYTVSDQPSPVRLEMMAPKIAWTRNIKRIQDLNPGQKVAVHYREQWPSLAVIDDFVR